MPTTTLVDPSPIIDNAGGDQLWWRRRAGCVSDAVDAGWWLASDGKWYPPQVRPLAVRAAPVGAPPENGYTEWLAQGDPPPKRSWIDPRSAKGRMRGPGQAATPVTDRRLRRFLGWELIVALAIFPLGSTLLGVFDMVSHLYTGYAVSHSVLYIPNEPAVTLVFSLGVQLIELAAAGLVFYLLARSGEGPRSIGLGRHQLRTDLALVLPVWF